MMRMKRNNGRYGAVFIVDSVSQLTMESRQTRSSIFSTPSWWGDSVKFLHAQSIRPTGWSDHIEYAQPAGPHDKSIGGIISIPMFKI